MTHHKGKYLELCLAELRCYEAQVLAISRYGYGGFSDYLKRQAHAGQSSSGA